MKAPIEGGCLCGGVRYRLRARADTAERLSLHRLPARERGAICDLGRDAREDIEILSGEIRKVPHAGRLRSFAACCGTPLFFQDDEASVSIDVTIASLDEPQSYSPEVAIWTEDRLPWVQLDPRAKDLSARKRASTRVADSGRMRYPTQNP